jgi:dipeptidase D
MDSDLLKHCKETYQTLFKSQPVVEVIHAGLECAVIGDKYPDMDMISIGPTMENPHSPDERLYIPSISKLWQFLVTLLASF